MDQPTNLTGEIRKWLARYDEMHAQHAADLAEHEGDDGREPKNYAAYDEQRFTNTLTADSFLNEFAEHLRKFAGLPVPGETSTRTFDPTTTSGAAVADLFRTWCRLRGDEPEGEVEGAYLVTAVAEMFQNLGMDVGGPASQVDVTAGQHVYTVFGLSCDHSDQLYVAAVVPGERAHAVIELETSEDHFGRWADTFTAESGDAAADMARRQVEDGDPDGRSDRSPTPTQPECEESNPHDYPLHLLDSLRAALNEWFERNPDYIPPRAVSFGVTDGYEDGPGWSAWGPVFHYDSDPEREERRDIPVDQLTDVNFRTTTVAEALVELDTWWRPQAGETLRIALHWPA